LAVLRISQDADEQVRDLVTRFIRDNDDVWARIHGHEVEPAPAEMPQANAALMPLVNVSDIHPSADQPAWAASMPVFIRPSFPPRGTSATLLRTEFDQILAYCDDEFAPDRRCSC